ncbi:NAD(P)/FAD-dependent oxidoreductase [candidate division WOR-3 bacterium]|nr:NAD(P)/FAD-dependent oxidoreductase [candidate division WOR-3 bacterium]
MRIIIIGKGPASISAIETIRNINKEIELLVISDENNPPYSPTLLPDYLLNKEKEILFWKGKDFFSKTNVQAILGEKVTKIYPAENKLFTQSRKEFTYDKLLIAAGGSVVIPKIEGLDNKKGVFYFKILNNAENILTWIEKEKPKRAVIIGAGFIGIDAAVVLKEKGLEVKVVEILDRILPRMLDKEMSECAIKKLKEKEIDVALKEKVVRIDGRKKVETVVLESGKELKCDILILAPGVNPNLSFIDGKLKTNEGIIVNEYLQSSVQNIFAAGDIIEFEDKVTGETKVNALHPNAVIQGRTAAKNMLDHQEEYLGLENVNIIKIFNFPVVSAGVMKGDVIRRFEEGEYKKFYIKDKRLAGLQFVGNVDMVGVYYSLMCKKVEIDEGESFLFDKKFNYAYYYQKSTD